MYELVRQQAGRDVSDLVDVPSDRGAPGIGDNDAHRFGERPVARAHDGPVAFVMEHRDTIDEDGFRVERDVAPRHESNLLLGLPGLLCLRRLFLLFLLVLLVLLVLLLPSFHNSFISLKMTQCQYKEGSGIYNMYRVSAMRYLAAF